MQQRLFIRIIYNYDPTYIKISDIADIKYIKYLS